MNLVEGGIGCSRPCPEETKRKISEARKNQSRPEESKRKQSELMKGNQNAKGKLKSKESIK